ncbi:tautomerase family protein [Paenibacillus apiarius]|uniref:Tautomerase family protein n=1 Tax=Paenibacillus apiarius TaxID=46240 RepID=A0ABT4DT07_9BACL|nr:tautomerase family protein [Paenibacillus apiarius]MCY9513807.1 tautomerase family protein [Paenibacillus apiarius]MCY9520493.1 tautomerase family protein [Paenibacillus apiarius]MCY9550626.1 tautomerase family protein [Paenibacillus apiarius]MCY9559147.1 tautomerase family protein [Paenibacillus apiarius]MCY9683058.1 tautomerase family protein [Paenibacillus apiarius]
MPFVRIDLRAGKSGAELRNMSRNIHRAMIETIDVPEDDYFQVITQHGENEFFYDPNYLNIKRTEDMIYIQITMKGRTLAKKRALYARIAERLHAAVGIRKQDVMIIVTETDVENWSFGNGIAQLAPQEEVGATTEKE